MQSFITGHGAVFMLNADNVIIAYHPQVADQVLPQLIVMASPQSGRSRTGFIAVMRYLVPLIDGSILVSFA